MRWPLLAETRQTAAEVIEEAVVGFPNAWLSLNRQDALDEQKPISCCIAPGDIVHVMTGFGSVGERHYVALRNYERHHGLKPGSATTGFGSVSERHEVALRNYERHHGLKPGSATLWQVQHSSAGIEGWANAWEDLDFDGLDEEEGLLVSASGTEDDSDAGNGCGGAWRPVRAGDGLEATALQRALLESVGVRFAEEVDQDSQEAAPPNACWAVRQISPTQRGDVERCRL